MKVRPMIYLLFAIGIAACDSTLEDFAKLDVSPAISLRLNLESDSVKIADKTGEKVYTFSFTISDEDAENLNINTATTSIGVFSGITQSDNADTLYSVDYTPNVEGWHDLTIYVQDRFNRQAEVNFRLFAFENLVPKGILTIESLPDTTLREYVFDASQSYDLDEKHGGAVTLYKFLIGEEENTLEENTMKFVFPQNLSEAKVGLQVMDNDGTWSEKVEETVRF